MTTFDFEDGDGPVPAHKHPNGGGWVAESAHVDETAYVGSEASIIKSKLTVFDREYFFANMTTYIKDGKPTHHEVEIVEKESDVLSYHFKSFDDGSDVLMWILNLEKKIEVINVCKEFVTEMEGYSYYGSNPGIPEDEIEDLVDVLMSKYFMK